MFAETIDEIKLNNIILSDPIKNCIVQQSYFFKIIYSNEIITLNGLYIVCNLKNITINKDKFMYDNSNSDNKSLIKKLELLEDNILNLIYKNKNSKYYKINKSHKIADLFKNEYIKYSLYDYHLTKSNEYLDVPNMPNLPNISTSNLSNLSNLSNNKKIIIKISGVWETKEHIGLTVKILLFNKTICCYPSVEKNANNI
jgi:hypothetical protein